jgi:DNA-binding CsgD family transcriptional regulator
VLLWVAQGKSNPEVASILGAAEKTIKVHLSHIFEKLGLDDRHAATLAALEILARLATTSPDGPLSASVA